MKQQDVWFRAVLLAIWGGTANLWVQRHYGVGIDDPISLLSVTGGPVVALAILDRILDEDELTGLKQMVGARGRALLRRSLLATPVLVLLYVGGIAVASTYSSVTVIAPVQDGSVSVEVTPLGAADAEAKGRQSAEGTPLRLRLVTNPFGRDVRLSVDGFVAQTVRVYPWTGLTVDAARDLQWLPTLLFRPSVEALASLADGGALKVFKVTDKECWLVGEIVGPDGGGALTIGPSRVTPSSYHALWHLELQAQGSDEAESARVLLAWSRPAMVQTTDATAPGTRLYAAVITASGKRKVEVGFTAGQEQFQDIRVDMPSAERSTCKEAK